MEKSFVTIEQHSCGICGKTYDTGNLLLDKHMKQSFDRTTVTGFGICKKCDVLNQQGYLALVGIDPSKSVEINGLVNPNDAYRTGSVARIRREVATKLFDIPLEIIQRPFCFVEQAVIDQLNRMINKVD